MSKCVNPESSTEIKYLGQHSSGLLIKEDFAVKNWHSFQVDMSSSSKQSLIYH